MADQQIISENLTMKEILVAMRRLGDPVTRKEIRQELRESSTVISEDEIDEIKVSKKTGKPYSPFTWTLNYAVKYLICAGYLIDDSNHVVEFSAKGRSIDLSTFDAARDVRPIIEAQSTSQKKVKQTIRQEVNEQIDDDEEAETWREKLLDALLKMHPQKFELFCRGLLTRMGIDVDPEIGVSYVADGGLDGFGYVQSDDYRTTRVALQAKRWQGNVPVPD